MKKLLFLIGLMVIAFNAFNQTDYSVDELPAKTTISANATEYIYVLDGTTDKHILLVTILNVAKDSVDALQAKMNDSLAAHWAAIQGGGGAWGKTGNYIYLTDLGDSVGIGIVTPLYKLHIDGNGKIDTLYASHVDVDGLAVGNTVTGGILTLLNNMFADDNQIYWQNNSAITEVGTELYFYSPTSGTKSLADVGASITGGSAITVVNIGGGGKSIKWNGSLTENTTITGTSNYYLYFNTLKNFKLDLDSLYLFRFDKDSMLIGNNPYLGIGLAISDNRTYPKGLVYALDYSSTIQLNDRSIPDVGTVKRMFYDTIRYDNGFIYQYSNAVLALSPNGDADLVDQIRFSTNTEPVGVLLLGMDALIFNKGNYLKAFRNDSTRTAYDDSTAWSAQAIRDYVAENGGTGNPVLADVDAADTTRWGTGGEVGIEGTPSLNKMTMWHNGTHIKAMDNFIWESGTNDFLITDEVIVKDDDGFVVQKADGENMLVVNSGEYSEVIIDVDSIFFQLNHENGGMVFWADKANSGDTCWMSLLPHGSGDGWIADTSETSWSASWATYLDSIGKFELFFATRDSLGELNWQRYKGDCYHKLNALTAFKQLQIAIEKNFAWDNEVRQRLDSLEMIVKENPAIKVTQFQIPPEFKAAMYAVIIFFIGLLVVIIRQQIQINKLEKR